MLITARWLGLLVWSSWLFKDSKNEGNTEEINEVKRGKKLSRKGYSSCSSTLNASSDNKARSVLQKLKTISKIKGFFFQCFKVLLIVVGIHKLFMFILCNVIIGSFLDFMNIPTGETKDMDYKFFIQD